MSLGFIWLWLVMGVNFLLPGIRSILLIRLIRNISVIWGKGCLFEMPVNYYKDDNPDNAPVVRWRGHANLLFSNWLNYYVYQETPFDINQIR